MKQIENARQHVRRDIERLNKKLENLTGINSSSEDQLEAYHLSTEEPLPKNGTGDITAAPLLKLPQFMRPTISSQRKSGISCQASEEREPVFARRKRPLSHRAESESFPVKDHLEYNLEHSISRSSCLVGLNMQNNIDNATEYSQETSETDAKVIDRRQQEREPRTSTSRKADIRHDQKDGNGQMKEIKQTKFSKVDKWLHVQKNEPTISGYSHRTKRVLAIPTPEKKQKCNRRSKAERFCDEEVYNYEFRRQNAVKHDQNDNLVAKGGVGRPLSEVVTDKPPMMLEDLFNEDSRSDVTSLSQTRKGKMMIQTQDSVYSSSVEDNECGTFSSPDGCCGRLDEYKNNDKANAMSIMQAAECETQNLESFPLKNCGCCEHSQCNLDGSVTYSKRDSGVSISRLELESCCQPVPTVLDIEDGERQDFYASCQPSAKETRFDLLQLRSKRALFIKNANQEDVARPFDKPQGKTQTTGKNFEV